MNYFKFDKKLEEYSVLAEKKASARFKEIDEITEYNQTKVLNAFIKNKVSETHLGTSTGYGYGDIGRDTLDRVFADCMGAEDAIVRHSFASGTHTLTVALFGILRPGDKVLVLTGRPYDTIIGVFGFEGHTDGSLADFGVEYHEVDLLPDGTPDINAIRSELSWGNYKMAYIQRSRGYSLRPSLTIEKIEELCAAVREVSPQTVIMVDNCYGEFVQTKEPTQVGADLIAGSLIKNAGGGIAPTGGYIAGKKEYVEMCAGRMTAPGVGREVGASLGHNRELYMGIFSAPHVTGEALKTAVFASALLELLGYKVSPTADETRADIIQTVVLNTPEALISFCRGMQSGAPVDSFVRPEPSPMPGYDDDVIMAAGAFTLGSSIELSADAPLRKPYAAWMQGGLNYHSAKTGILLAVQSMMNDNALKIKDKK
ncbi:MAG: methionine gamma-lyase family protein [Acutalibacteraceae bacterium]|nr:methionine gamma-lyase family protein [Acutalibacteraceae bacterium]